MRTLRPSSASVNGSWQDSREVASRLSCQIPFTEQLDGLRVRIAEED